MRILYFDCFSGISGDMVLGALIDCGIDVQLFLNEIKKLDIEGYRIEIAHSSKNGIGGTDVNVILDEEKNAHSDHHDKNDHNHHDHRNLKDITYIIENSELAQSVKDMSIKIFNRIAEAEAKIHCKDIDEVHFHEVGAVDSIIDIVGASICINLLHIDKMVSSAVNTGYGFVNCQHGIIPVPAPATVELLKGIPVYSLDIKTELVTPTGAAILSTLCSSFGPIPDMTVEKAGYGLGKKDLEIPNLLRVIIGDQKKNEGYVCMIECNIDDMDNELYEHVMDKLFKAGALDVFLTNIIMKKSRPAVKLSILSEPCDVDKLTDIVFSETSTIGIRKYNVERETLNRNVVPVKTTFGEVKIKVSYHDGKLVNYAPEYEDIKKAAFESGVPAKQVYFEAVKEFLNSMDVG